MIWGRSLRGNVDRNGFTADEALANLDSRSLRGNVDRNKNTQEGIKSVMCRSLRGNVDRNHRLVCCTPHT